MFNNLIESSSHLKEFKRRSSFLLLTGTTYLVLFAVTGVVSIYAYDAHLEDRTSEIQILEFAPLPQEQPEPAPPRNTIAATSSDSSHSPTQSIRTALIDSASNPMNVPKDVGTIASDVPEARTDSKIGARNFDPPAGPGSNNRGVPGGTGTNLVPVDTEPPPPDPTPIPTPAPIKTLRVSTILNGQAKFLPKPVYPRMATSIRLQGIVSVQVLIDESGNVVSAKAVSGHPILIPEAQRAAMQAKFSPTIVSGQPVKVSGVISYNFTMPN